LDSGLKVTDQQQEISFSDVVSGDNVVNIPLFQRAYRWGEKNLKELWDDLDDIVDEKSKSQFLGVLVLVTQARQIGRPVLFDVVDGQQRLSTCYLIVLGLAHVAAKNGESAWAIEVVQTYLLLRPFSDNPYNTKLVPAAADRQQFKTIWDSFRSLPHLASGDVWKGHNQPSPPAPAGLHNGAMIKQFNRIIRRLGDTYKEDGLDGLGRILHILVSNLSFVQISLRDPTAAPKIFERLNARGERITTGDLVRNEVFSRVANDPSVAQAIFSNNWQPFENRLLGHSIDFERFLFPYGLIFSTQITKADLFSTLRKRWDDLTDPISIISDMERYFEEFIALETGNLPNNWSKPLRQQLLRFHEMGAPSSIYSFIFQLFDALRQKTLEEAVAIEVMALLEGFLFRRAICGYEPTGLHAVFKGLWKETNQDGPLTVARVASAIGVRTTVPWPDNAEFEKSIKEGDLYARNVRKFALREFERHTKGETPADDFQIEHIAPQTATDEWRDVFGDNYRSIVNTWANLIPITPNMNPVVGQSGFTGKQQEYSDSIFASTRELAKVCETWGPADVEARAQRISDWAIQRWPTERPKPTT
jgi:hypothetical protein